MALEHTQNTLEMRQALMTQLDHQIEADEQVKDSQSWLQTIVDKVWCGEDSSFDALKELKHRSPQIMSQKDLAKIAEDNVELKQRLNADLNAQAFNDEVVRYGTGFVKSVPLFIPGTSGLIGTIAVNALDQARPTDPVKLQILDASLGGVKGLALKETLNAVGSFGLSTPQFTALKGVAMGTALRTLDVGLERRNYLDQDGNFSLAAGTKRLGETVLNPRTLVIDAMAYGISSTLIGTANSITGHNLLLKSPLAQNAMTGATFGFTNGMIGEAIRQKDANEEFNYYKIAGRGLLQATVDGLAAVPGGYLMQRQMRIDSTTKITVREATPEDLPGMQKVAKETLPIFTRGLKGDYMLVAEAEGKGIVGHLVLDTAEHRVRSMAVLPQYRRVVPQLQTMMMERLNTIGGEWSANARETTSYPFLLRFAQRGRLQITEDSPMLSVFGERFHHMRFRPSVLSSPAEAPRLVPQPVSPSPAPL